MTHLQPCCLTNWIQGAYDGDVDGGDDQENSIAARDGNKSIRQIAKDFNVSRNTVRKVLRSEQTRFEYCRDTVYRPKLGSVIDTLTALLEND